MQVSLKWGCPKFDGFLWAPAKVELSSSWGFGCFAAFAKATNAFGTRPSGLPCAMWTWTLKTEEWFASWDYPAHLERVGEGFEVSTWKGAWTGRTSGMLLRKEGLIAWEHPTWWNYVKFKEEEWNFFNKWGSVKNIQKSGTVKSRMMRFGWRPSNLGDCFFWPRYLKARASWWLCRDFNVWYTDSPCDSLLLPQRRPLNRHRSPGAKFGGTSSWRNDTWTLQLSQWRTHC